MSIGTGIAFVGVALGCALTAIFSNDPSVTCVIALFGFISVMFAS